MAQAKTVYIACFNVVDPGAAIAQAIGAALGGKGDEDAFAERLKELFTER